MLPIGGTMVHLSYYFKNLINLKYYYSIFLLNSGILNENANFCFNLWKYMRLNMLCQTWMPANHFEAHKHICSAETPAIYKLPNGTRHL